MLRALFKRGAVPLFQRKNNKKKTSTTGNGHQSSTRQNSCFQPTSRQQMKGVAPCCSSPPSFHSLAAFVRPFPSVLPPPPRPPPLLLLCGPPFSETDPCLHRHYDPAHSYSATTLPSAHTMKGPIGQRWEVMKNNKRFVGGL